MRKIKAYPVRTSVPRDLLQCFPAQPLGVQIRNAIEHGVTNNAITPRVYDDDDCDGIDPQSDIRTDNFAEHEAAHVTQLRTEAAAAKAKAAAAAAAKSDPPASNE